MSQENKIELLWSELTLMNDVDDRKLAIYSDAKNNFHKYKILAEEDPHRLFEILGGNDSEVTTSNWAFEYSYEDYILENDIEYDVNDANDWNLEGKSIEHAHNTGHWYVTGTCVIEGPENIKLVFEFEYCEGYFNGIIGTPYNECEHGNHGIEFA